MPSQALVIGVADYAPESGNASYPEIRMSARMYGEVLASDGMWGRDHCRVLDDSEVETADGVMTALQETAAATSRDDTLLVVYIGHGHHWRDLPDNQVYFALSSSYEKKPWTWLSSWYVYRAMRNARAKLKVLITDCCYSHLLPTLGEEPALPGVLGESDDGTCVFTAIKRLPNPIAEGCPALPDSLNECTPFSGHLLNVLRNGTRDNYEQLTMGLIRDAVEDEMGSCQTQHRVPYMRLNGAARDHTPLFTNKMSSTKRDRSRQVPGDVDAWVLALTQDRATDLHKLLEDERQTGTVVARLSARPDARSRRLARQIADRADKEFKSPDAFARYWNQVRRSLRT